MRERCASGARAARERCASGVRTAPEQHPSGARAGRLSDFLAMSERHPSVARAPREFVNQEKQECARSGVADGHAVEG